MRALTDEQKSGALIIVGGRLQFNDDLQENIHTVTNRIYQLWRSRGYAADRIYYLAVDQHLDPNGDGVSEVNGMPTVANLRSAITTWAIDKVGPDRPLTLYLVDHGEEDQFLLDAPYGEILQAAALDSWLDQLAVARPNTPINIIIEACKSGSFIAAPNSISGDNRVVLTSTEAYALAYGAPETGGIVFSDALLDALMQGHDLHHAFVEARERAQRHHDDQIAWLDDDGNGLPNERTDGDLAVKRGFVFAGTLDNEEPWAPYVVQAEVRPVNGQRYEIWAEVLDDQQVKTVWAAIYPPSYTPPAVGGALVQGPLPTQLQARGDDWFGALYGQLEEIGTYRIVVYAEDEAGLQSRPREVRFTTGSQIFLPLIAQKR